MEWHCCSYCIVFKAQSAIKINKSVGGGEVEMLDNWHFGQSNSAINLNIMMHLCIRLNIFCTNQTIVVYRALELLPFSRYCGKYALHQMFRSRNLWFFVVCVCIFLLVNYLYDALTLKRAERKRSYWIRISVSLDHFGYRISIPLHRPLLYLHDIGICVFFYCSSPFSSSSSVVRSFVHSFFVFVPCFTIRSCRKPAWFIRFVSIAMFVVVLNGYNAAMQCIVVCNRGDLFSLMYVYAVHTPWV